MNPENPNSPEYKYADPAYQAMLVDEAAKRIEGSLVNARDQFSDSQVNSAWRVLAANSYDRESANARVSFVDNLAMRLHAEALIAYHFRDDDLRWQVAEAVADIADPPEPFDADALQNSTDYAVDLSIILETIAPLEQISDVTRRDKAITEYIVRTEDIEFSEALSPEVQAKLPSILVERVNGDPDKYLNEIEDPFEKDSALYDRAITKNDLEMARRIEDPVNRVSAMIEVIKSSRDRTLEMTMPELIENVDATDSERLLLILSYGATADVPVLQSVARRIILQNDISIEKIAHYVEQSGDKEIGKIAAESVERFAAQGTEKGKVSRVIKKAKDALTSGEAFGIRNKTTTHDKAKRIYDDTDYDRVRSDLALGMSSIELAQQITDEELRLKTLLSLAVRTESADPIFIVEDDTTRTDLLVDFLIETENLIDADTYPEILISGKQQYIAFSIALNRGDPDLLREYCPDYQIENFIQSCVDPKSPFVMQKDKITTVYDPETRIELYAKRFAQGDHSVMPDIEEEISRIDVGQRHAQLRIVADLTNDIHAAYRALEDWHYSDGPAHTGEGVRILTIIHDLSNLQAA